MARRPSQIAAALLSVCVAGATFLVLGWMFLYFGLFLGVGNFRVRGHQEFAANGIDQIAPAAQMEALFEDCQHYITYGGDAGRDSVSVWNSVAFFGGRYELSMQVPVAIESSRKGRATGEPRFLLLEVGSVEVSATGQVGASFGRNFRFGLDEWQRIYEAGGDFGVVGFEVTVGPPVAGFEDYVVAHRR